MSLIKEFWGRRSGGFWSTRKDKHGNVEGWIVRGRRAHQTMKGTNQNKINSVGSAGGHGSRPQGDESKLAANAMALGWLNGRKIRDTTKK